MIPLVSSSQTVIFVRGFARGRKKRLDTKAPLPLANEKLITELLQRCRARSVDDVPVRVVADPRTKKVAAVDTREHGKSSSSLSTTDADATPEASSVEAGEPPAPVEPDIEQPPAPAPKAPTELITLAQAIQRSIDQDLDLIEISIDQKVPVVTLSNLSSMVYAQTKALKKKLSPVSAPLGLKEITMRAGIADNDLRRKVDVVQSFMDKGHVCQVSIRATRKHTWNNADALEQSINRVLHVLGDATEIVKAPEMNEQKSNGKFQVRSRTGKKS